MFELVQQGWHDWKYKVLQKGSPIGEINLSFWADEGRLTVNGAAFTVRREGLWSGAFLLESNGEQVATAEKPSAFRRSFTLQHGGKTYTFKDASADSEGFLLMEQASKTGFIRPAGSFTIADLPDELPLPTRFFLLWLMLFLRRRGED